MAEVVKAAGLLIFRKNNIVNEYLMLQASCQPYHWTPPKGHVDPDEDEWTAALRETKEEAGIDLNSLTVHKNFCHVMHYEANKKPKKVTYWLAQFNKDDSLIKLSFEHQKSTWVDVHEAIQLTKFPEMEKMLLSAEDYINSNKL